MSCVTPTCFILHTCKECLQSVSHAVCHSLLCIISIANKNPTKPRWNSQGLCRRGVPSRFCGSMRCPPSATQCLKYLCQTSMMTRSPIKQVGVCCRTSIFRPVSAKSFTMSRARRIPTPTSSARNAWIFPFPPPAGNRLIPKTLLKDCDVQSLPRMACCIEVTPIFLWRYVRNALFSNFRICRFASESFGSSIKT